MAGWTENSNHHLNTCSVGNSDPLGRHFWVSVRSDENLHFHGTSNTSKKLYHLQISEIFTSSKNDNFENSTTSKNDFYIFQGLLQNVKFELPVDRTCSRRNYFVDDTYRHPFLSGRFVSFFVRFPTLNLFYFQNFGKVWFSMFYRFMEIKVLNEKERKKERKKEIKKKRKMKFHMGILDKYRRFSIYSRVNLRLVIPNK